LGGGKDGAVQRGDRRVSVSGALLDASERGEMQGSLSNEAEGLGRCGRESLYRQLRHWLVKDRG